MTAKINIIVDGRQVEAEKGAMLLDVIQGMGVPIPTLCHHPSLEPSGACRLCVVEVTHPDWNGWSGLVTSCLYPVEDGIQVFTRSDRVAAVRRTLLEMLLARCPDSTEVRELAAAEGVDATDFLKQEGADKCVVCGLCVRVCQDLGPGAIAPLGRGAEKEVGPGPGKIGEECTGCGACSEICPTGEIRLERRPGVLSIWNRDFSVPVCRVEAEHCRGCGVCEQVCPVAIPRVMALRTGTLVSYISADACHGCGLCAGACPAGAIRQEEPFVSPTGINGSGDESLKGRAPVFACSRSPIPRETADAVEVPCVGRVTVEGMLECLARGADGVLILGRDSATCQYGKGEDQAEKRVRVANDLAAMAGLGSGRIRFALPQPGLDGPKEALHAFRASLSPSPLDGVSVPFEGSAGIRGMDRALDLLHRLFDDDRLTPVLPDDLAELFGCSDEQDGKNALYLGDLPVLDRLLSLVMDDWRLFSLFDDAARLLAQKKIAARPLLTAREVRESGATRVFTFCRCCVPDFGESIEVVSLDSLAGADELPRDAGASADFRFRITPLERKGIADDLAQGRAVRAHCPREVARYKLIHREGAWRFGLAEGPEMVFSDAVRACAGKETT